MQTSIHAIALSMLATYANKDVNASQEEDSAFSKVITSLVSCGLCRLLTNQDSATTPGKAFY